MEFTVEQIEPDAAQLHQWAQDWATPESYVMCEGPPYPSFRMFEDWLPDSLVFLVRDEDGSPRTFLMGNTDGLVMWASSKPFQTAAEREANGPSPQSMEAVGMAIEALLRQTRKLTRWDAETGMTDAVRGSLDLLIDAVVARLISEGIQIEEVSA